MAERPIIIPPRVPFVDQRTGMIAREWFLWLLRMVKRFDDAEILAAFAGAEAAGLFGELSKEITEVRMLTVFPPAPAPTGKQDVQDARLLTAPSPRSTVKPKDIEDVRLLDVQARLSELKKQIGNLEIIIASSVRPPLKGGTSAVSSIADNAVVRGDGGTIGIQGSLVILDDNANVTGVSTLTAAGRIATPLNVSSGTVSTASLYAPTLVSTTAVSTDTLRAVTNVSSATVSTATVFATDVIGATRVSTATVSTASVYAPTLVSTVAISTNTLRAVTNVSSATVSTATVFATDLIGATRTSTATVSSASVYAATLVSTAATSTGTLAAGTNVTSATVSTATVYATDVIAATRVSTATVSTASVYAPTLVSTAAVSSGTLRAETNMSSATVSTLNMYGTMASLDTVSTRVVNTDPGADRILFWDDSASTVAWLTVSTGLALSGTDLTATAGAPAFDELTDVNVSSAADGDYVRYDDATSTWFNVAASQLTTDLGLSSMAYQEASSVAITGGIATGLTHVSTATVSTATVFATDLTASGRVSSASVSTAFVYAPTLVSTAAVSSGTLRAQTNMSSATVSTATVFATDLTASGRVSSASVSTASVYAATSMSTVTLSVSNVGVGANVSSATVSTATVYATDVIGATRVSTATVSSASVYAATSMSTVTMSVAGMLMSSTLSLTGSAANISVSSNFISYSGTDAGITLDGSNNLVTSANLLMGGTEILFGSASTDYRINPTTADTTDNARVFISAGGAYGDVTRGAYIQLSGNEEANTGLLTLNAGNVAGGNIECYLNAGALELKLDRTAGASRIVNGIRIGADSTNNLLDDASNGAGTQALFIGNAQITAVCDIRIKDNMVDTVRDAIAIFNKLRVVDHTWNDPADQSDNNKNARGVWTNLIAQEADEHIPWIVNRPRGGPDFLWQMDYEYMAPLFVKGFQQMDERLRKLECQLSRST